jgi:hypothetical protein
MTEGNPRPPRLASEYENLNFEFWIFEEASGAG